MHERHQRLGQNEWSRLVNKTERRVREIDRISVEQTTAMKALLDCADLADEPRTDPTTTYLPHTRPVELLVSLASQRGRETYEFHRLLLTSSSERIKRVDDDDTETRPGWNTR